MEQVNVRLHSDLVNHLNKVSRECGKRKVDLVADALEFYLSSELWRVDSSKEIGKAINKLDRRVSILENSYEKLASEKYQLATHSKKISSTTRKSKGPKHSTTGKKYKLRLDKCPEKLEEIKRLWNEEGIHNRKEIAKHIDYPKRTVASRINRMIEKGELTDEHLTM